MSKITENEILIERIDMPEISIIMPVYNKQNYVKRSLDSVLDQVFSDFELIVVDDGSADDSPMILEEYQSKDPRIRVIHTENGGVSHARNVGLENAQGKWIQFLDGDDTIEKEYLSTCQTILTDIEPDILFTSFQKVNETGTVLEEIDVPLSGLQTGADLQISFLETQDNNGFYGFPSNKLFKKLLVKNTHARFREGLKLAEDLDFFVQLYGGVEQAYYAPIISYKYLINDENYAGNADVDYIAQLSIRKRIREWAMTTGAYEKYKETVDGAVCRYAAFAVFGAALRNRDIAPVCNTLMGDETVNSCLNERYVTNPVHKRIVTALQKNKVHSLSVYLGIREKLKRVLGR